MNSHPAAKAFVEAPKPPPVSYATLPYFGLKAFTFTNAKGVVTFGRYRLRPVAGEHFLTKEQVATKGPGSLTDEIGEPVRRAPVKFALLVQVPQKTTRHRGSRSDDRRTVVSLCRVVVATCPVQVNSGCLCFFVSVSLEGAPPLSRFEASSFCAGGGMAAWLVL